MLAVVHRNGLVHGNKVQIITLEALASVDALLLNLPEDKLDLLQLSVVVQNLKDYVVELSLLFLIGACAKSHVFEVEFVCC